MPKTFRKLQVIPPSAYSATAPTVPTTETEADLLLYPGRGCIARFALVVRLMKGTSTMGTSSETNLGSMLPINMQQKFEKVLVLKEDSAHNSEWNPKTRPWRTCKSSSLRGPTPRTLIYFAKNNPRNHQITWLRSVGCASFPRAKVFRAGAA